MHLLSGCIYNPQRESSFTHHYWWVGARHECRGRCGDLSCYLWIPAEHEGTSNTDELGTEDCRTLSFIVSITCKSVSVSQLIFASSCVLSEKAKVVFPFSPLICNLINELKLKSMRNKSGIWPDSLVFQPACYPASYPPDNPAFDICLIYTARKFNTLESTNWLAVSCKVPLKVQLMA